MLALGYSTSGILRSLARSAAQRLRDDLAMWLIRKALYGFGIHHRPHWRTEREELKRRCVDCEKPL